MISCILLTAGDSLRFGSPKALADIKGTKAIELVQQKLITSSVDEIIVVTGAHEEALKPYVFNHSKVRVVHNKDHKLGQTSSFQKGLNLVDEKSCGIMLWPVDCPFVSAKSIDDLCAYFHQRTPEVLIPSYQARRGHPPIFHSKLRAAIQNLSSEQGLNSLLGSCEAQTKEMDDPGIVWSFNTKEELAGILALI